MPAESGPREPLGCLIRKEKAKLESLRETDVLKF
jgi:hypothetical protein